MELLIARNPDPDNKLPFLLRLPIGDGLVFRTKDTWPRTSALYCHPVPVTDWPIEPDVVDRVALRACHRRGVAIDVIGDRGRENRSQIVFTRARGREMVFWQSPRTRKQARPDVRLPTARASGIGELEIVVDAHERYAYRFADQQVRTVTRGLACGTTRCASTGKWSPPSNASPCPTWWAASPAAGCGSLWVSSPRCLGPWSSWRTGTPRCSPSPGCGQPWSPKLAELQVRWPSVAIVFCETRKLAEEWTYRYLAAAFTWASGEQPALDRIGGGEHGTASAPPEPGPSIAEVRAWAQPLRPRVRRLVEGSDVGPTGAGTGSGTRTSSSRQSADSLVSSTGTTR